MAASPTLHVPPAEGAKAAKSALARQKLAQFLDGFVNQTTGVGTSRSKVKGGYYQEELPLDLETLEGLFKDHDLARKIVSKPVDDAMRVPFTVRRKGGNVEDDAEDSRKIMKRYRELMKLERGGTKDKRGATWARLFGGGGLILGVRGAGALITPLDDKKVTKIEYVMPWDRKRLHAIEWAPDGEPTVYRYFPRGRGRKTAQPFEVHASRLLFFPGALTTDDGREKNQGWDYSVLQAVYQTLMSFDQMFASTDAMFADASQAIFKLQGLIQALADASGEGDADVRTRLQLMDQMRSSTKAVMLEAPDSEGNGGEDFEVVERTTLGTLDGIIQQYYVRLAAAANMPLTVLLGMAPSGMDATGESDMILYFNTVDVYRQEALGPQILRVINMLAQELELNKKESTEDSEDEGDQEEEESEWEIVWPELARPKPLDVATKENMVLTSMCSLVEANVLLPEEVALNLRTLAPSLDITIDLDSRLKALKEALTEVTQRMMTGPTKPEEPKPVAGGPKPRQSERKTPSKAAKRQVG